MTGTTNTAAGGQGHQYAGAERGLLGRCRDFVTEQSAGEWDDKTIANDADKLMAFVSIEDGRAFLARVDKSHAEWREGR